MQNLLKFPYGRNILNMKNIYPLKSNTEAGSNIQSMYYTNSNITYNNNLTPNVITLSATTYTMPSTNTILIATASSNAITITLPTAIGIQKVYYKIVRTDTTLTNAITINTSLSQTIGGSATSKKMYTANEVWEFESDGANWIILNHFAKTAFSTALAPVITTTPPVNPPTPGTGSFINEYRWKRENKNIIILYRYRHTSAGTIGSGDYLFSFIPSGITIDTSITGTYTNIESVGAWTLGTNPTTLLGSVSFSSSTYAPAYGIISIYSTTQVRIFIHRGGSLGGCMSSAYFQFNTPALQLSASFIVPITEFDD